MVWKTSLGAGFAMLAIAACTTASTGRDGVGWTAESHYTPPTHANLLLYGPAAEIAEVIEQSRAFGWSPVEQTNLPSGSAFALMAGPTDLEPNERIWHLITARRITAGPAMTPRERRTAD